MTENGFSISELMTKNKRRNLRHFFAYGALCITVLIFVIVFAVLFTGGSNFPPRPERVVSAPFSLEEWLNGSFYAKTFNGSWLNDDQILYRDDVGHLKIYEASNGSSKIILNGTNLAMLLSFDHQLSADRKYLLIASDYQRLFRYTYMAKYKIVNLETLEESDLVAKDSDRLQSASWAPTGNALVYVSHNNIYYRPRANVPVDYQITTTGVFGVTYNGVPDWVYEEEVFHANKAYWFSPNGGKLVFGYFDDAQTSVMHIPFYGYPGSLTFQYPTNVPIHYPKAGTANPKVKLYCVDLQKMEGNERINLVEITSPETLEPGDRILTTVSFAADDLVSATWMNRVQNQMHVQLCNLTDLNCSTVLSYREAHGWVEQFFSPLISQDGSKMLLILPREQKSGGDWRHLVLIENATSQDPEYKALTSGTFEVTEIASWDQYRDIAYYLASTELDVAQQHLYKVHLKTAKSECISCGLRTGFDNSKCLYSTAKFSTNNSYYAFTCLGPGVPETWIHASNSTAKLGMWEGNEAVALLNSKKSRPETIRLAVPVSSEFKAEVRLLVPPNADLSGKTKYPMLVYVYGGPNENEVTDKFNVDWGTYLATNKSIIYTVIDGRGSGLKGNDMLFSVYRRLGTAEILDQLNVTRQLHEKFPFIDKSRTSIWGWSYGGFATAMALAMDFNGVFKCGMSIAPVTDWALYDSFYTEKYMGLPTSADNLEGYEQAQLLNKVENIRTKNYYLIHGTMDDNVHYQQSLLLAKVLEQKDILFRQQSYTDEDHSIGQARAHLYHSLENFLDNECNKQTA